MSNAIWIVSQDLVDEGLRTLSVFTTRRKMLEALDGAFDNVHVSYIDDMPSHAHVELALNKKTYLLSLDRHNLDVWSEKLV